MAHSWLLSIVAPVLLLPIVIAGYNIIIILRGQLKELRGGRIEKGYTRKEYILEGDRQGI